MDDMSTRKRALLGFSLGDGCFNAPRRGTHILSASSDEPPVTLVDTHLGPKY
jgi:hypothetical protein